MSAINDQLSCQSDQIAAYVDGELDEHARLLLEQHLRQCSACSGELAEQRLLLCALDSTLSRGSTLPLPTDFARVVAARAESDMSGMRDRSEHRLALRLCVALAVMSFVLIGAASRRVLLSFAGRLLNLVSGIFDLVWTTIYDAVSGLTIISRVLGKGLMPESLLVGLIALLLLACAVWLLSRLISNYHRTRLIE